MKELAGRTAVVTGAARGIGRALVEAFLDAGMQVVASDVDGGGLAQLAGSLPAGRVRTVTADVSSAEDVRQLADFAFERGPVHLLCNNAGVVTTGRCWELSLDTWERVVGVDLWGPIHGVREFVPRMLASGEPGHVVNIASMASLLARPGIAPYTVSKHGVLALGETLGRELHEMGAPISVTTVFPGRVATDLGSAPSSAPPAAGVPAASPPEPPDPDLRSPQDVAAQVVRAVREGERFLFTHPERRAEVAARMAAILGPDGAGA